MSKASNPMERGAVGNQGMKQYGMTGQRNVGRKLVRDCRAAEQSRAIDCGLGDGCVVCASGIIESDEMSVLSTHFGR